MVLTYFECWCRAFGADQRHRTKRLNIHQLNSYKRFFILLDCFARNPFKPFTALLLPIFLRDMSSNTPDSLIAMTTDPEVQIVPPRSGTSFSLRKGQKLRIIDPQGLQVSDLLACNLDDVRETLSNGRTFDYNNTIYITKPHTLYSNRSNKMLTIVADTVGRHDFLFTPCSRETFLLKFPDEEPHRGCFGNLADALSEYRVTEDQIPVPFNCFMHVEVAQDGEIRVRKPLSKKGDYVEFVAEMDLVVGLTACSAARSNSGEFKEIHYTVSG